MRDSLTGLAIVLILVLTAALAAPYFVDWNGQRGFLEARLTHALGQKVTIGGNIDLKLLPTPYLVLDQVVIGGDEGPITVGIHHLDLELAAAPLLTGAFDITNARLEEPIMRVTLQRDRTLPTLPAAPAFQADVRFDHVRIADGTLAIADPRSGHTFVFDHLDFDAQAPALAGPYKAIGAAGEADARTRFRLGTTAADHGRTHAHLAIDETQLHAGLDLDGTLALVGDGQDALRQTFVGTAALFGQMRPTDAAPVAWRLAGPLQADPAGAKLADGELRIGPETASLALKANVRGDFDGAPTLHVDLAAKQLDIDRLSGAPVDAVRPPPPRMPDLASWRRAFAAASPPLPTSVDLSIDSATWGGEAFSDLVLHLGAEPLKRRVTVSGQGPGGSTLALGGTLDTSGPDRFEGTIDAAASDLPAAVTWLRSVAPDDAPSAGIAPFARVRLRGQIAIGDKGAAVSAMSLDLDRSTLTGRASLDSGRQPAKLEAALRAKVLDVDGLPDIDALRAAAGGLDLDVALDAAGLDVARLAGAPLKSGPLSLAFSKAGGRFELTRFKADDLGGATIAAKGTLDPSGGALTMTLDAAHLEAAAALVRSLYPGDLADALVARAPVLAPAKLAVNATLAASNDQAKEHDALGPAKISVTGTLGRTTVDAGLEPGTDRTIVASVHAKAPEGGVLLRQIGVAALPIDTVGDSEVTLAAHGAIDRPLATTLAARFGDTRLSVAGRFDLLAHDRKAPRFGGAGTATLSSPDASPLLRSLAIAAPDLTGRMPAEASAGLAFGGAGFALSDLRASVAGVTARGSLQWEKTGERPAITGALDLDHLSLGALAGLALGPRRPAAAGAEWSSAAFGPGLLDPPTGKVALKTPRLDLGRGLVATDATLDLGIAPQRVTVQLRSAALAGGRIQGDFGLRRDGGQAALEGKVVLDKVAVDLPELKTRLSGTLDYAGSGSSPAALVGGLAGTGTATLADATIPRAGPEALRKVFDEVEADTLAIDEDSIVRALEGNDKPFDAGTRAFDLGLAAGTLHLLPKGAGASGTATAADGLELALDLGRGTLEERVRQTLDTLPKGWTGPPPSIVVAISGPPLAPKRGFDVGALVSAVATRALARESARLEAYEFDIKERAYFNQRLASERRREQDRLQAEADARAAAEAARKAEAERRARAVLEAARRAEAARVERQRREEARAAQRAARAIAEQEKAAQERAEQDKAAQDRAAQDRAAQDRAPQDRAGPDRAPTDQRAPESAPATPQDAAPQTDRRTF